MLRRALKIVAGMLALPIALAAAGVAFLQTEAGGRAAARALAALASTPGQTELSVARIEPGLPFRLNASGVALADKGGEWLAVDRIAIDWRPLELLRGRLVIEAATASGIRLVRLPARGGEEPAEPPTSFHLPSLPFGLQIGHLALDDVEIGPAVAGEAVTLSARGRLAAAAAGRVETSASIVRTDGVGGEADLNATWMPASRTLAVDLRLDEPEGGLLGAALGLTGRPPVHLSVGGEGPIDGWRGNIRGRAGHEMRLDAQIRSEATAAGLVAHASGTADVAALLGDGVLRTLAERGVDFKLALRRPSGDAVHVDALELAAAGIRLTGTGAVDLAAGRLDAHLALAVPDGSVLSPIIAPVRLAAIDAVAEVSGTLSAPVVVASATASQLRLDEAAVDEVKLTTRAWPAASRHEALDFEAAADLAGIQTGDADVDAVLGDRARLIVTGTLDRVADRVSVSALALDAPALSLSGEGSVDLARGAGEGRLRGTMENLATLRAASGPGLAGRADLAADVRKHDDRLEGTFSIQARNFHSGLPALDALLGRGPRLHATFAANAAQRSGRLDEVVLEGEGLRAQASVSVAEERLEASYRTYIADVTSVAAALGVAAQGSLGLDGTLSGPLADPNVAATLSFERGSIAGATVSPARMAVKVERLVTRAAGELVAAARVEGDAVHARVPFVREGGDIRLGPFAATAPGLAATGELRLPPAGGPVRGAVALRTGQGGRPATLAGFRLAGATETDVRLGARGGEQTVEIVAQGRSLALTTPSGPAGSADEVSLRASLAGPPARLRGEVDASVAAPSWGGVSFESLQAHGSGNTDEAAFRVVVRPPAAGGDEIRLAGTASRRDDRSLLVVQEIDGKLRGQTLALRRPLLVTLADGTIDADALDLAIGAGSVAARGRLGGDGAEGSFVLRKIPLVVATAVRPDFPLTGTVDAEGSVRSRGGDLTGALKIDLADVRATALPQAPAMAASASATLAAGAVTVEARSDIEGRPLAFNARIPARVDARTLQLSLPTQAPLRGRLTWSGPIAKLWELVPLPDQRLTGDADVRLALAGTLADPQLTGEATLTNGRYEHFVTATVIEGLEVAARADGAGAMILTLRGSDGESGTVSGEGTVAFGRDGRPLVDLTMRLASVKLLRRDDVSATLSGALTFRQNARSASITGAVTADRMDIRLIDRLPPSVVVLDVKEINLPPGLRPPPAEASAVAPWTAALDLSLAMPGRIFVRGRGLESEWQGKLKVSGTTAAPIVTGEVSVRSGTFDFAGKRFTLEKGDIAFTGGSRIDPTLDVIAVRETAEITAQIRATGAASAPKIELSSQPALPDSEILARILFGKDVAKLGPVEIAQLGLALDTLASGESMSEDALSYLRNLLGLDVLTVESGEEPGEGPALGVGRYVGEGVYVGARQGTEENSTAGTVEIELLPGLSLESEVSESAEGPTGALGLRWKWDY